MCLESSAPTHFSSRHVALNPLVEGFSRSQSPASAMSAPSLVVLSNTFITLNPGSLGCLVTNAKFPGEDVWPESPLPLSPAEFSRRPLNDTVQNLVNLGVKATICQFISVRLNHDSTSKSESVGSKVVVYSLFRPHLHLNRMCLDSDTKRWIEMTLQHWPIYMVVGLITVIDADFKSETHNEVVPPAQTTAPVTDSFAHSTSVVFPPSTTDLFDSTVENSGTIETGSMTSFIAPNERVIGVRYRKLKFQLFSSEDADAPFLKANPNRWILLTGERDGSDDLLEADFEESIDANDLEWEGELNGVTEADIQVDVAQ